MSGQAIQLRAADYERLLRVTADVRVAELELAAVVERAKQKIAQLQAVRDRHLQLLAASYEGFAAEDVQYRPDDATCTLHVLTSREVPPCR